MSFLLLFLLVNFPMALLAYRSLSPLAVSGDGTSFSGRYSGLKVTTITGRVLATNRTTTVSGGGSVSGNTYSNVVIGSSHVTTTVHDNLRLKDANGRQHDIELVSFGGKVVEDDVVTVGYVSKRGKSWPFVLLNHTSGTTNFGYGALFHITWPGPGFSLRLLIGSFLSAAAILSFTGIPLAIALYMLDRRQRTRFMSTGVEPLWAVTTPVAAQLQES